MDVTRPWRGHGRHAGASVATMMLIMAGALVAASPASAATPVTAEINGITYTADSDDVAAGAVVTDYDRLQSADSTVVDIPDEVTILADTYAVVGIDDSVFSSEGLINEVTIGDNVTMIGAGAFYGNTSLDTLTLGSSVVTIGNSAFEIGKLGSVVVPDSVVTIGDSAFSMNRLTALTLGSAVETIGDRAFFTGGSAGNELETLVVPDSVTSIGNGAFYNNELTSLTLGNSVQTIAPTAFEFNNLTNLSVPDSVTSIGSYAFTGNQLTHVVLGRSVADVGSRAFGQNPDLTSVVLTGEAPNVVERTGTFHSFDSSSDALVLTYPWRFGDPQTPGGYTSPRWEGYDTQAIATVAFDLNGHGSTAPGDQEVPVGDSAAEPPTAPTASDVEFTGWYTGPGADVEFDFSVAIEGDATVYAGWQAAEPVDPDGEEASDGPGNGSQHNEPPTELVAGTDSLLPDTGGSAFGLIAVGVLALVAGSVVLLLRRRLG